MEKEGQNLIMDAGTCATYDSIDADKNYHGGAISPGLRLRYESLIISQQNCRYYNPETIRELIGNSTDQSIPLA
jgi:type III pantothenate kinase